MAQRSGDVRLPPDVREIHTFEESSSFGTGPSGDVPPPVPGSAVPRPRSTTTRGRDERRSSAAAPLPWRDGRPSASEEDCRMVDGVRRALRFLFEAEQYQLEQALHEELSNTQVGYLMHCPRQRPRLTSPTSPMSSIARAVPADSPGAHTQPPPVEVMPITTLAVPVQTCRPQAAPALLHLQLPVGALGPMPRTKGTLSPTQPRLRVWASRAVAR